MPCLIAVWKQQPENKKLIRWWRSWWLMMMMMTTTMTDNWDMKIRSQKGILTSLVKDLR